MRRFMIAGTNSGCGKTTVSCGILQALVNRGIETASFKCGPDYIDPMFHSRIIGTASYNLDSFFCDENTIRCLFAENSKSVSVAEGVMGFYDGVNERGSSHEVSQILNIPVIIVIDCKGASTSIGAVMKGFLTYRQPNNIKGFIFNRLPEQLREYIRELCSELDTEFLGSMPVSREGVIESRHLGLLTADEVDGLHRKTQLLGELAEKYIDIDRLIELSDDMPYPNYQKIGISRNFDLTIAVAKDEAFCFIYDDNINLLKKMGCRIEYFSPLYDKQVENADGIILSGGYPELYADKLSENKPMLESIRKKTADGIPVIAECGGFMYLNKSIEGKDGKIYAMTGIINADSFRTERLQRFGYINMTAETDTLLCRKSQTIKAHEFHYWNSTDCGNSFNAVRESNKKEWKCVHADKRIYAGFPHIYFYSDINTAVNFLKECEIYRHEKN